MGERETDKKLAGVYEEIHGGDLFKCGLVELFDEICIEKFVAMRKGEKVEGSKSAGGRESYLSDITLIRGVTDSGFPMRLIRNRAGVVTLMGAENEIGFQSQNSRPCYIRVGSLGLPNYIELNVKQDPTTDFGVWAADFYRKASLGLYHLAKTLKAKSSPSPS